MLPGSVAPAAWSVMFMPTQTVGTVLCCIYGVAMQPNPANMCTRCIRAGVNIIEGVPSHAAVYCPDCTSYLQPPRSWLRAAPESPELMQILLRGLNRPLARPSPAPSSSSPSPTPSASTSSSAKWIPVLDGAHARSPSPVLTPALRPSSPPRHRLASEDRVRRHDGEPRSPTSSQSPSAAAVAASLLLCSPRRRRRLRATAAPEMAPKKDKAPPPSSKPAKSGGGKQKKKKWSKGKQKEKVNNSVLFDQATYDKLLSEVPKYKQITPSVLSERLRINGSLARRAINDLMTRGLIRMVSVHSSQQIYTRATNT
ncbi:hypothetical protein OsJ_28274 [Oryza sativa Japonica Group]|uniref:60S ribosomal export protein NMD3 n=1 Tax=Oryza sativa subsp. japonica TaxID=39947 RepID=B9FYJ7_ORYSJ|nr:hypothetical protein OsJ_28274 [Oryza sativa Japonica Group]